MQNKFMKPRTLEEALNILSSEKCMIISGGTDVMVEIHSGKKYEETLVDISSLKELKEVNIIDDEIIIGAACTHNEIETNPIIKEKLPMLAKGSSLVGSTTIRNRGTIGGNVVNNSTCADTVPPLLVYDAKVVIASSRGERNLQLKDFFMNKGKIDLKEDEILKAFVIKPFKGDYKWDLVKVGRRKSLAISRITMAIAVSLNNGIIVDLRICPGAMLPKHGRLWETENCFKETEFNENIIAEIGENASKEAINQSGRRWSTEYKEPVLKGLIIRSLEEITTRRVMEDV